MGIGLGLILIALGAVLTWAVEADVSGLDIRVVGVIMMLLGLTLVLLDLFFWRSWTADRWGRATYVEDAPVPVERRRYAYWPRRRRATIVEDDVPGPPAPPP